MFKKMHVFRIKPDSRIMECIKEYCESNGINSAVLVGMIGSLKEVELAFLKELPGRYIKEKFYGPLELVSSQGTVAKVIRSSKEAAGERWLHIHIVASNEEKTVSGHLVEGTVFTTAEIVLGELDFQIERYHDEHTGLKELVR
jgi:predicted DNA-binding protein with PD1-like motif